MELGQEDCDKKGVMEMREATMELKGEGDGGGG
jgi:hypothetical protein